MKGITLIGTPGAGKSTIGKKLAERLGALHDFFAKRFRNKK